MYCPRTDHFIKLTAIVTNQTKVFSLCCHMVDPPRFESYEEIMASDWYENVKRQFADNQFPKECKRCMEMEDSGLPSVRHSALDFHTKQTLDNYLIADIVIDNLCNGGCIICSPYLSTKIGSLNPKTYHSFNNLSNYKKLPLDKIVQLDITGGEPTTSKNVEEVLDNLPPNVKKVRINTNGTLFFNKIFSLLEKNIKVELTISLDGTGKIYEYVRWPGKWEKFENTIQQYLTLAESYKDLLHISFWSTINVLNIANMEDMIDFSEKYGIYYGFSLISKPNVLTINHKNKYSLMAKEKLSGSKKEQLVKLCNTIASGEDNQDELDKFIEEQDKLRNNFIHNYI